MSSPEVERMLVILRSAVRMSQLSNREVERRLQWSSGYLSRLFAQDMELKMEHVLSICSAIGFSPAEFFRVIFPRRPGETGPSWIQALSRLHPVPPPGATDPPRPTRSTAAARSEAATGRPLSKRGRPAEPPAPPASPAPSAALSQGDLEKMLLSALRSLLLNSPPPPPSPPPTSPPDEPPPRE